MKKKIIIISVVIIAILTALFFINKNNETKVEELKKEKIELELRQDKIFFEQGTNNKEYKELTNQITDITRKINKYDVNAFIFIFPIIFAVVFITIFVTIISNFFRIKSGKIFSDNQMDNLQEMASKLSKVATDMAIDLNPEYKSLKCPNCGAPLKDDIETCEYCHTHLTKVASK